MASLQPVRGTHDLLPEDSRRFRRVIDTGRATASLFGCQEIATPIFEFTEVFARTLGDTSDIVTREMYTFVDRGGDSITLRPEGTAGVARALISGGLAQNLPLRYFYHGPMFRYERPQKGRLRQFHQIGIEILGIAEPLADIEAIALAARILDELGVGSRVRLELNSIGDPESRAQYRAALVEYFGGHRDTLSEDSRARLERNPLRILDSKDAGDRRLVDEAPLFPDYLNETSRRFFDAVRRGLDVLGVPYHHNPRLVRGLDYYSHTAFEFTTEDLGAQGTVLAGGRYDGLIATMGGPAVPGIGWAAGIERLAMMIGAVPPPPRPIAVIPVGPGSEEPALKITGQLRQAGFAVDLGHSGNLSKRLKRANRAGAHVAVLLGADEIARNAVTLRDLDAGTQEEVPLAALADRLARFR